MPLGCNIQWNKMNHRSTRSNKINENYIKILRGKTQLYQFLHGYYNHRERILLSIFMNHENKNYRMSVKIITRTNLYKTCAVDVHK